MIWPPAAVAALTDGDDVLDLVQQVGMPASADITSAADASSDELVEAGEVAGDAQVSVDPLDAQRRAEEVAVADEEVRRADDAPPLTLVKVGEEAGAGVARRT